MPNQSTRPNILVIWGDDIGIANLSGGSPTLTSTAGGRRGGTEKQAAA